MAVMLAALLAGCGAGDAPDDAATPPPGVSAVFGAEPPPVEFRFADGNSTTVDAEDPSSCCRGSPTRRASRRR